MLQVRHCRRGDGTTHHGVRRGPSPAVADQPRVCASAPGSCRDVCVALGALSACRGVLRGGCAGAAGCPVWLRLQAALPSACPKLPALRRAAWRWKSGRKEGLKFDNGTFTYHGVFALAPLPTGRCSLAGSGSLTPSPVHPSPASTRCRDRQPGCADWASCSSYCPSYSVQALADRQLVKVTWPQYLGALAASRTPNPAESPNSIKPKIVPSSQTTLRSHQNTAPGREPAWQQDGDGCPSSHAQLGTVP
ncbi:uncharacterized protein LOC127025222 [Gymnogyps californianus]|uniref:uncharacterized protein LOC127025222 n=1 Tax=Gymnogyps californianus TaxID=33616 RepID=UPI0021C5CBC3|nr:uncharacterized protein LOC127025222 [Gymnogyps californianus]